jgi:hypothetical protein
VGFVRASVRDIEQHQHEVIVLDSSNAHFGALRVARGMLRATGAIHATSCSNACL